MAKASSNPANYRRAVAALKEAQAIPFTDMSRVRHKTAVAKAPQVIEHVRGAVEAGGKVIVMAHHQDVVDIMREALADLGVVVVTGATPVAKRQSKPDGVAWILRNHPEVSDAQIGKLIGTTRNTIAAIRDRSHWNIANITPKDPVTLGLCSQRELDFIVFKAAKKAGIEDDGRNDERLTDDREALIEELRAERDAASRAASEAAQEAEVAAWLQAKRAAEAAEEQGE